MVEETAPEKRYSLFHPLVLSFYSADLYKEVAATWRARAFVYLLLLLALCWLPITVKLNQSLAEYVKTEVPEIAAGIPTITISHGEVFIDAPQPHVIYEPSSGQELAILDTTGQVTSLDGMEARLLLTKTSLVYAKSQYETRSWDLSEVEDFVLDEELVLWFFDLLSSWLVVLLYPLAVAASYIFRLALVPFYGGIGLLLSSILKTKLAFLNLCALAIVAMTPGVGCGGGAGFVGDGASFFVPAVPPCDDRLPSFRNPVSGQRWRAIQRGRADVSRIWESARLPFEQHALRSRVSFLTKANRTRPPAPSPQARGPRTIVCPWLPGLRGDSPRSLKQAQRLRQNRREDR